MAICSGKLDPAIGVGHQLTVESRRVPFNLVNDDPAHNLFSLEGRQGGSCRVEGSHIECGNLHLCSEVYLTRRKLEQVKEAHCSCYQEARRTPQKGPHEK